MIHIDVYVVAFFIVYLCSQLTYVCMCEVQNMNMQTKLRSGISMTRREERKKTTIFMATFFPWYSFLLLIFRYKLKTVKIELKLPQIQSHQIMCSCKQNKNKNDNEIQFTMLSTNFSISFSSISLDPILFLLYRIQKHTIVMRKTEKATQTTSTTIN